MSVNLSPSPTPRRSSKTQGSPDSASKLSPVAAATVPIAAPAGSPSPQSPQKITAVAPTTSSAAHTIPLTKVNAEADPDLDPETRKRKAMEPPPPPVTSSTRTEVDMKDAAPPVPSVAHSTANAEATPERPAKKTRTNTPWTPAEEKRLKAMRDENKTWSEIAKMFPNRTEGSVKKHWYKDMHYADFAEDESQALLQAIKEYDANKWKVIGQKVGKPAKACEQYAKENFAGRM